MATTNYHDTFIAIADDSPVQHGMVPPDKKDKTVAALQYDMIAKHPYRYTSDDVIFGVHALRHDIPQSEYDNERTSFFSKGQACMRASPLSKKYGWGVHSNQDGKIAIYGVESAEYEKLLLDTGLQQVKAMRSSRK